MVVEMKQSRQGGVLFQFSKCNRVINFLLLAVITGFIQEINPECSLDQYVHG